MAFKITTTGVQSPVIFYDLGERSYTHPTTSYDLELEFTQEEIRSSYDIQNSIDNYWITVQDAFGNTIINAAQAVSHGELGGLVEDEHLQYPFLQTTSERVTINSISSQKGEVLTYDSTSGNYINLPGSGGGSGTSGSSGTSGTSGSDAVTKYVTTISSWILSGSLYYADVTHNLNSLDILVEAYLPSNNMTVGVEEVERLSTSICRIWSATNIENVRVIVLSTNIGMGGTSGTSGTSGAAGPAGTSGTSGTSGATADLILSVPSSDLTGTGTKITATVDTNATGFGAALYMASDGNFDETDADAIGTMPCRALALETGTGSKQILLKGLIRNDAWGWTAGLDLFVSQTTGALTHTAPSGSSKFIQKVGFAWTDVVVYFDPGDWTVVESTP